MGQGGSAHRSQRARCFLVRCGSVQESLAWTGHPFAFLQSVCPNTIPGSNNKRGPGRRPHTGAWGVSGAIAISGAARC